jgi:glycosyltransferase involved in cell wall biosynthesis
VVNLEYFNVDGGSTDGTVEIIRNYEKNLAGRISEPDRGITVSGNRRWISATDLLHVGGLAVIGTVFRDLPSVEWIIGHPTIFNPQGKGGSGRMPPSIVALSFPCWNEPLHPGGIYHRVYDEVVDKEPAGRSLKCDTPGGRSLFAVCTKCRV